MHKLLKIILPLISTRKLILCVFLGMFSGLSSFLFVNCVTRVVALIIAGNLGDVRKEYAIFFASIILLFIWTRKTLSVTITRLSQTLFWELRMQVLSVILKANCQQLNSRRSRITTAVLSDVSTLMDVSLYIIQFSTSSILAISCLIYLLSISMALFFVTIAVSLAGILVYLSSSGKNERWFQSARSLENEFSRNFFSILNGFKEIFMEPRKGAAIYNSKIKAIANESYKNNLAAYTGFINNQITGQILFYILITFILLFFSLSLKIKPSDLISFVFTLLYLLSSIESILLLLPVISRARVASNHLVGLKTELEELNFKNRTPNRYILKDEFDLIEIRDMEFYYGENGRSFGIGPLNFSVCKGEAVFIYGGNGSGKTTLIHSILGLCSPSAGEIRLNGNLITAENYAEYRTIFSVVFSDFYLFDEVLGIADLNIDKWNYYLSLFELEGKVKIDGTQLSTTDLSTGQRKRLALIVALLEEKPVLVIDEWAADQDPHFRKKFYTEIIPLLKDEGITIIAITHDDRYYHCSDKLYKMDYGKITEETVNIHNPLVAL